VHESLEGFRYPIHRSKTVNQVCKHSLALLGWLLMPAGAAFAQIVLPPNAEECVRWAARELESGLSARGIAPAAIDLRVIQTAPKEEIDAQSFAIRVSGSRVTVEAGGAVGAMYGLQELEEQLTESGLGGAWADLARAVRATAQRPFTAVRADNMFIHVYPLQLSDLAFWRSYIDMLARNRFNLLDLHGSYDLQSTSFPNLYPMLVHVPEYPQIGNEGEQAKNLANFRTIIAYAHSRGLKVAFMNYSANDGKGGAEKNAPSITGVPPEKLADYTAKAVAGLIRELPELDMLGFRVGESGQPASFYERAYVKGVRDADRADLRLYTRSWQTTKEQLVPIARAARNGFDIEVKFNGEHLGLPYQAMQGASFGSYSYQGYLDVPADYRIIWQVRANGTHRFWAWENTDFIRRTVRTFSLGAARGFTLEPPIAYFSTNPADYYRSAADISVYTYIWEKNWMWYYAWGRLAYDPGLPEEKLVRAFGRRYGAAGPAIYAALQHASEILPLAYSYRFVGPDQRDFSPETETGNALGKRKTHISALLQFIDNHPMDERSFEGIGAYVDDVLASRTDGRVGPLAVASRLSGEAAAARSSMAEVPALSGPAAGEWRLLKADLESASDLGDYYADRIRGMTHLGYSLKTGSEPEFRAGVKGLADSRAAWAELARTADAIYRPLSNPLRRQLDFQWSGQLAAIEKLDATASTLWTAHSSVPGAPALPSVAAGTEGSTDDPADLVAEISPARDRATIRFWASPHTRVARVTLWFKPLPSQLPWQNMAMTLGPDGSFVAPIPLTPRGLMYLLEVHDNSGRAYNFPSVFKETPYRVVPAHAPQ